MRADRCRDLLGVVLGVRDDARGGDGQLPVLLTLVILDFPEPDPGVVYVDTGPDELCLEKPPHLARHESLWRHVQATALSVEDSRALIRSLIDPT